MTTLNTRTFDSRAALDDALEECLRSAIARSGATGLMLSGGNTPMPAYRALAQQPLRHDDRLHVLFTDERYVPSDSDKSNYYQSKALLDILALPEESLLRVRTELTLPEAAADYERRLSALLSSGVHIEVGLLGLGPDGHTCSLFSADDLKRARGRYAISVQRPDGMSAVSVTPELLATVRRPIFVVAGTGKEAALAQLTAQDLKLTAWAAVQGCTAVELWVYEGG